MISSQRSEALILYGIGKICSAMMRSWQIYNPDLFDSILCFTDSRSETWGSTFFGKPVIPPHDLSKYNYSKIIIATSERFAPEIYHLLQEQYHVSPHQIIPSYCSTSSETDRYEYASLPNYRLYPQHSDNIKKYCIRDWLVKSPTNIQIIHHGFILPHKYDISQNQFQGGVCDENGVFVTGHLRNIIRTPPFGWLSAYPVPSDTAFMHETVVYGGFLFSHYGHMITESFSRLWWYLENPCCEFRFAFLFDYFNPIFMEFLYMLGLKNENILLIDKPMQFESIIIPEQASILGGGGYHENAINVYNTIRNSVVPANYEKVYLTRTNLNDSLVNEAYFEQQYRSMGYHIIAPELLTIKEQIAIIAGAKQVACLSGTLAHNILFGQEGLELTILCRSNHPVVGQYWINQIKKATCTMVDISMSFLYSTHIAPGYLVGPTIHWQQYAKDMGFTSNEPVSLANLAPELVNYLNQWATQWMEESIINDLWINPLPLNIQLSDTIIKLYQINNHTKFNEIMKQRLYLRLGVDYWNIFDYY